MLELIIYFVILILVLHLVLHTWMLCFFCWLMMFSFTFGLAMILMIVGHYGGELSKLISIVFTILYFISGVLYSVHVIPEPYLSYLMYNPFIHNLEMIRHVLSPTYPIYHVSMSYFIKWIICVNFFRLAFVQSI